VNVRKKKGKLNAFSAAALAGAVSATMAASALSQYAPAADRSLTMNRTPIWILMMLLTPLAAAAQPAMLPAPSGVVNLNASAASEADNDTMMITLYSELQTADAASGSATVNKALAAAISTAKQYPKVTTRSGGYNSYPVFDRGNKITAWRIRADLMLESKSFQDAGELAGKLQGTGMLLSGMSFSLSRDARAVLEKQLTQSALKSFGEHASLIADALAFSGYSIREISVQSGGSTPPRPLAFARSAAPSDAAPPVSTEAGTTTVNVTVSGSIQLEHKK
jgi:predicted secreted protein